MSINKWLKNAFGCLCLLIFSNLISANAQTSNCKPFNFNLTSGYQTGQNTFAYTTADFNNDGKLDVSVINAEVKTVSVLFGDGSGGFAPPQTYPSEINPRSIASGDLNSDGKSDLIIGSFSENKIAVLLNNGQGGFLAPRIIVPANSSGQFVDLKTADFNGDGNLDVAAVSQDNAQLKFFLGDGQGNLTLTSTLTLGGRESEIEVGYLNGDNLPDVIAFSGDSFTSRRVQMVIGRQSGAFTVEQSFFVSEKAVGISIADLNGDGSNDLAIAFEDQSTPTTHLLQPWFNNGSGTFVGGTPIEILYFFAPSDITTGDFNGDGKIDLAAPTGSVMTVVYGVGNGTFQNPTYWAIPATRFTFAADVNGDNQKDLLLLQTGYSLSNSVAVLLNDNNNGFRSPKAVLYGATDLAAADLNNDNFKDLISSIDGYAASDAAVALNDRSGGLLPDLNFAIPADSRTIKTGDFNGDGNSDVVTAHSYSTKRLSVMFGNGTGNLAAPVSTAMSAGIENIVVGDFNQDNKDDVFAVDQNGRVYSMLGNGNGTFTAAANFFIAEGFNFSLEKGDFNRDNKLDVAFSSGSSVTILLGDGNGQFQLAGTQSINFKNIAVGDVNGDNNPDVIGIFSSLNSSVTVILGNGSGGFGDSFAQTIPGEGSSIVSADFNNDGLSDVAFASDNNAGSLIVIPGSSESPHLGTPVFYPIAGLNTLIAADFNGDGKPDIGFANRYTSRGVIYNTSGQSVCLSINDVVVTEGDMGNSAASFTVNLSAPASVPVRVNYALEGRAAAIGTDLQNTSGRLEIPAGQTSATIVVNIVGDLLDEFDEDFAVKLSSPANANLSKSIGTGTIVDNDAAPSLTVSDVSQNEPAFSQGFNFRVNLSAPSGKTISFRYATADGTAVAGRDYNSENNTWNIQPGTTFVDLGATVLPDNIYERDENFFFNISNPVNAVLSDNQGEGKIINDDSVPTLNILTAGVPEGDTGTTSATVTLQLSNPTYLPVTLNVLTSDGTALAGRDYTASDTTVMIPAEQQSATSTVQLVGDTINEPNETFFVNLYNVVNANVSTTQTQVLIVDDESIASDFDRDGKTDVAVFRPSDGKWYVLSSLNGSYSATQYGLSTDMPVSGDYNGDGRTDFAVWRPASGTWYTTIPNRSQSWGVDGDTPVPGDYDNDGRIDVAVFRQGTWYWLQSSDNQFRAVQFGLSSDKPVPADYDGDGKTDIAVFRPSNGTWYILRSGDGGFTAVQFGIGSDKTVPADYDGDGRADVAVFRDGVWYLIRSTDNAFTSFSWGIAGDKPVPGNYDGDEKNGFRGLSRRSLAHPAEFK